MSADWLRLFRPAHWIKNLFVLGPLLFSGRAFDPPALTQALLAFAAFCLVSSGVYAINDVMDRDADRIHPIKRARPVAAGRIATRSAIFGGLALILAGLALASTVSRSVVLFISLYVSLNVLYMWRLKEVVVLDVFVIASFFVIRLLTGAAAVDVEPSVWLLLCGGLLALYLGFTKRRHELVLLGDESAGHRGVLAQYTPAFLDQMSMVLLSVTVICYIMYTLESATANAVGTNLLSYSAAFVLYGVFRYLFLVHQREGGSPTHTLLNDRQLLLVATAWLVYCGLVIYRPL
ncbi:MAG TPA: decaprenyl-phosphate phosphoribosyltransferase [Gemmatimonadaceae bacterium]|nr:decaprenyl-phosphate phosphoribosyltransferase [Gemmatimonadaceae bacterium]